MRRQIRHCVECPTCKTRYLIGFSPYQNGAYLLSPHESHSLEYRLYCFCGRSSISKHPEELSSYAVSKTAHYRGYGSCEEIVPIAH